MSATGVLLGLECGGTRTIALATDGELQPLVRIEAGPCNLRLVTDEQLAAHFRALAEQLPAPTAVGVGMAGVRDRADCQRVERVLATVWPGVPQRVDHDLESALAAAEPERVPRDGRRPTFAATVIVLSGTGSCCYGRNVAGLAAKVGGWGHQLGDRGSAYDIVLRALRTAAHEFDHTQKWGPFGQRALRALQLNEPNDLIAWLQGAGKTEVAALAPEVFAAAAEGDRGAKRVLADTAEILAGDALACAGRLAANGIPVRFVLAGSVLLRQPGLARALASRLRAVRPEAAITPLARESAWGAVTMARSARIERRYGLIPVPHREAGRPVKTAVTVPRSRELSPTEQRNPRSTTLDRLPLASALELMLAEDAGIPDAIRPHSRELEKLIRLTVRAFKAGGRLFYVGAGTSGRLGVLDASECPPTFRTSPEQVQGIMAGGVKALHSAVEGAEDDDEAGARAVAFRGVGHKDVVVGLAASGRTPFVWGALAAARARGAKTALVCFNPFLEFAPGQKPDVVLAVDVGPEVLTGSTRLKAGTATKLILNALTTLAMVRTGKVMGNLMVDLNPSNVKLRDRACRIVAELTGRDYAAAQAALEKAGWKVTAAVRALSRRRV